MLYYPDWNGSNRGCIGDGQEPYYMLVNSKYYLSESIEECCEKFYEWDYYTCTGTTPELKHGEYYPDWSGGSSSCSNDIDEIPPYMINNQAWYFSSSLRDCCERHFHWDVNECLGTEAVGSGEWYVKYDASTCVQDCDGASPCGGLAATWDETFSDKKKCCKEKLWWSRKCISNSAWRMWVSSSSSMSRLVGIGAEFCWCRCAHVNLLRPTSLETKLELACHGQWCRMFVKGGALVESLRLLSIIYLNMAALIYVEG